jgi:hypothetical protein
MPFIRIDTNANEVAWIIRRLANRIPDAVLLSATNQLADEALELYKRTCRTWTHQPEFWKEAKLRGNEVEIVVGTNDQIYSYVDFGTDPHYIVAVDAPMLIYPEVYIPKTQPRVLDSGAASDEGRLVRRTWVWHTGAKARNFSEEIDKRMAKRVAPVFRGAVLRWLTGAPGAGLWSRIKSMLGRQ